MKKIKFSFTAALLATLVAGFVCSSCNGTTTGTTTGLEGKWTAEYTSEFAEDPMERVEIAFMNDGKYVWKYFLDKDVFEVEGTWSVEGDKIAFTYDVEDEDGDGTKEGFDDYAEYTLEGETLTLNYADGDVLVINKMK